MRVKMSKQPPPTPTASAVGPCPTVIQIVGRPGTGTLPSTIAPPPLVVVACLNDKDRQEHVERCPISPTWIGEEALPGGVHSHFHLDRCKWLVGWLVGWLVLGLTAL